MKSRWAPLLICLVWSPVASADARAAAPAPQLNIPTVIPSDGVLPLFGGCFDGGACAVLRAITVADATSGKAVAGHIEVVQSDNFEGWGYFVPDKPFQSGSTLLVKPTGNYPVPNSTVSVIEPSALDAAAVVFSATLSKERTVLESKCCPFTNSMVKPRCLDTSVMNGALLAATLSPAAPVALQYVYEVSLFAEGDEAGGTVFDFTPLRTDGRRPTPQASFGTADSYCYTVRAKPIVGGEPVMLLERCIDNDLTDLGRNDRTPAEVAQWSLTCQPGPGQVDGGTPNPDEDDATVDAGLHVDHQGDELRSNDADGCQLASAAGLGSAWWAVALALFARAKRKRGA